MPKRLIVLIAAILAAWVSPLHAEEIGLARLTCVGGAATQAAALAIPADTLDCGPDRFRNTAGFVRIHTDLSSIFVPRGRLYWQTDPSAFDSMILRLNWSDRSVSVIDVDPAMAVRNWAATARFSVPLPAAADGVTLAGIDMVVENPRMLATMRDTRLATPAAAALNHFDRTLYTMLAIGMLVVPVFYTFFFFRLMRARFMLWHAVMSGGMALFVACNSGVIFWLDRTMTLGQRWQLNTTTISIAVAAAIFFTIGMLESGVLGRKWRNALYAGLWVVLVAKVATLVAPAATRTNVGWYFALAFLPLLFILPAALVSAVRRKSRAALYAFAGFGVLALSGILMMIDGTGLVDFGLAPEDTMLGAMVFMSIITSAGVGDRLMAMRMRLDRERRRAAQLGELAFSDALTGLANRRAFDARGVLASGQALLVADLDHFKTINDRDGHAAGDAALGHLGSLLRGCLESTPDTAIYRLGGEEFGIVLPMAGIEELAHVSEAIRAAVAGDRDGAAAGWQMTVSIGAVLGRDQTISQAYGEADRAMYRAKAMGRNCCCIAREPVVLDDVSAANEDWTEPVRNEL